MIIEIITKSSKSIREEKGDMLSVRVDGEEMLHVYDDVEEPENNRMNGSFASIYGIRTLLERVYAAGVDVEYLEFKHIEI
jgi:hypothetical protein